MMKIIKILLKRIRFSAAIRRWKRSTMTPSVSRAGLLLEAIRDYRRLKEMTAKMIVRRNRNPDTTIAKEIDEDLEANRISLLEIEKKILTLSGSDDISRLQWESVRLRLKYSLPPAAKTSLDAQSTNDGDSLAYLRALDLIHRKPARKPFR